MSKGSVRVNWDGKVAPKSKGEKAGSHQGVLGWLARLPEAVGPDWVTGDAVSRSESHRGSL